MFGWDDALAALPGLIGAGQSLLGGGNNQAAQDRAKATQQADRLGDIQKWWQNRQGQQDQYYSKDNANARAAADKLHSFYNTDPLNDSRYAMDLARANDGLHANVARAKFNNLDAGAVNGSPTGTTSGINAYLSALDALGTNMGQVKVAQSNMAQRQSNMTDDYGLETSRANTDYGNATQATNGEDDVTKQLMDYWNSVTAGDQAAQTQGANSTLGALGELGSVLGSSGALDALAGSFKSKPGQTPAAGATKKAGGGYGTPLGNNPAPTMHWDSGKGMYVFA